MEEKIVYDFDAPISRAGTHAEKYDARKRFFGTDEVEPFWVADMDLPTPAFVLDALRERLAHPMLGYTESYPAVFEAISGWMLEQHGARVAREETLLSPSVVTSISAAVRAFAAPGERVVLLSPVYGPFFSCSTTNGREVADCPLRVENGRHEIDWPALEAALADSKTRLMLLCNPHNPGGRVWTRAELERLAAACAKHDVVLFSDEIHSDIVHAPARHCSMLTIDSARENLVVAHSIGKTFNTSGLQASFIMAPNASARKKLAEELERAHSADINLLGKVAISTALSSRGAEYKRQLNVYLRENTRLVVERLARVEGLAPMTPEATFLVWCDFREHGSWRHVVKRLIREAKVAWSGGTFFGPAGEGWFRVNCGHPRAPLLAAVDRVVDVFS